MAEKEEKTKDIIYLFSQEQVCKMCDGKRHGICDCCDWKEMPHLSRQEIIERMANALSLVQAKTFVDEIQWERVMNGCRYEAEAALNALLEGK